MIVGDLATGAVSQYPFQSDE